MKRLMLGYLLLATTAFALEPLDQPYQVALKRANNTVIIDASDLTDPTLITGKAPYLSFNCTAPVDCTKLSVTIAGTALTAEATATARTASYRIPLDKINENTATSLTVSITENNTKTDITTVGLIRTKQVVTTTTSEPTDLDTMLKNPCTQYLLDHKGQIASTYDEENNLAVVYVYADGTFITDPPENFDDNDNLEVRVIADTGLGRVSARRSSPIVRRELHIVGEERRSEVTEHALVEQRPCTEHKSVASFFGAPRGEVQLRTGSTVVGSFELPVNRRYWGIYSMGPIRTRLGHQSFKVVKKGDQNVIARDVAGKNDFAYALFVTPYWTGPRDIEKRLPAFDLRRLNPTVGITLQHTADNILVGGTYDAGNVLIAIGWQGTRQTIIDPASGLKEGSVFTGTTAEIPTVKKLRSGLFVGVTLDLRAALGIFTSAVRGATQ